LKGWPYKIEWFNFPAAQPLGEALNAGAGGGGNPLDAARFADRRRCEFVFERASPRSSAPPILTNRQT
jgi:sulfonate transport system substrate-binding protein